MTRSLTRADRRPTPATTAAGLVFFILLSVYALTGGGQGYSVDGRFGYEMARSIAFDQDRSYLGEFRRNFARWGIVMPLLGQPLLRLGHAIGATAPPRDGLYLDGQLYVLREWTPLPLDGTGSPIRIDLPQPLSVTSLRVVSYLALGTTVSQAVTVAEVRLGDGTDQDTWIPLRAGLHTAEWAYDRPGVSARTVHRRATVAGQWDGVPDANIYWATIPVDPAKTAARVEIHPAVLPSAGDAVLFLRALALKNGESGEWIHVSGGPRLGSPDQTPAFFERLGYSLLNGLATATTAVLLLVLVTLLGYGVGAAAGIALAFGLGTLAWPYATYDFSEPTAAFFLVAGTTAPYAARRYPQSALWLGIAAGVSLVLAVGAKYTAAIIVPLIVLQAAWLGLRRHAEPHERRVAIALVATLALLGMIGLVAMIAVAGRVPIVLGEWLGGLQRGWLSLPIWIGLRGLLLSPGKSIFLYAPVLILAVLGMPAFWSRHRTGGLLFLIAPWLYILVYSMKDVWHGGGWGPRYLVMIVPFLVMTAAPLAQLLASQGGSRLLRTACGLLLGLSCAVQVVGVSKHPNLYPIMFRDHILPQLDEHGTAHGGRDYWEVMGGAGLARALRDPDSGERRLGYAYGEFPLTIDVTAAEPATFRLSLYAVDWDHRGRRQSILVKDARGWRQVHLDRDFSEGVWLQYPVEATARTPVEIYVQSTGPDTAVLSALAFDPHDGGGWGEAPIFDSQPPGQWSDRYGSDGYVLLGWNADWSDRANLPAYVQRYGGGERVNLETHEPDIAETPLLYGLPFTPLLGHLWFLSADAVATVYPDRPDLLERALASPPWRWWGLTVQPPHPEHGMGLDLWPAKLYDHFASHPRVLGIGAAVVLMLWSVLGIGTAHLITLFQPGAVGRWLAGLTSAFLLLILVAYVVAAVRV
ncbi:MAG: hypothetical protein CL878_13925 [Dehalococcoidia bacterium]|nr:hypothetical protein [Dehalococcoidia bacterium]